MLQKTGEFETKGGCSGFAIGLDSGAVAEVVESGGAGGIGADGDDGGGVGKPGAKLAAKAVRLPPLTVGAGGAGQDWTRNASAVAPLSLRSAQGKLSPAIFSAEDSAATARSERREWKVEGQGFKSS